jgi:hypothetical protein
VENAETKNNMLCEGWNVVFADDACESIL